MLEAAEGYCQRLMDVAGPANMRAKAILRETRSSSSAAAAAAATAPSAAAAAAALGGGGAPPAGPTAAGGRAVLGARRVLGDAGRGPGFTLPQGRGLLSG